MIKYFNGEKLKLLRKSRGLTTIDLGKQVNLSQSYISRFENNKAIPDVEMLGKILAVLDSNLSSFFYSESGNNIELQELESILRELGEEEKRALISYLKVRVQSD